MKQKVYSMNKSQMKLPMLTALIFWSKEITKFRVIYDVIKSWSRNALAKILDNLEIGKWKELGT